MIKKLLSLGVLISSASWAQMDASEIVARSDAQMRGDSSYSTATMSIIRPDWTRSMSMKSWTKGQELSLVLITAPAKDKGSASLKRYAKYGTGFLT